MKKELKIILLIGALVIIAGLTTLLMKKQPVQILFYSNSCSHCKVVEQYINDNKVKDYLIFRELEVSTNPMNSQLLAKKAASCGLATDGIGVPFFYDGTNCLVGDQDIIKYFSSKK